MTFLQRSLQTIVKQGAVAGVDVSHSQNLPVCVISGGLVVLYEWFTQAPPWRVRLRSLMWEIGVA